MTSYKLPKEIKKKMEREIKQYYENKKILDTLKQNPKIATRRYLYIEQRLQYVENVYNKLKPSEKQIYDLIFKNNCNWLYCQTVHNISKICYYSVYNKSLYYLAEEFGEI